MCMGDGHKQANDCEGVGNKGVSVGEREGVPTFRYGYGTASNCQKMLQRKYEK